MTRAICPAERLGVPSVSRRGVLGLLAGSALLLSPFASLRANTAATRSVSFVHTHTGEKLSVDYWCDGRFQTQCLTPLNQFLRDFRTGEVAQMDAGLLDILYELVLADRDATYEIISAYRSPHQRGVERQIIWCGKKVCHGRQGHRCAPYRLRQKLQQLALANQHGGVVLRRRISCVWIRAE
jgi:uncharacterized protein YcbK (DUF882 family)